MDNDNLSKIPVSELTPENLKSLKGNRASEEVPKPKSRKPQGNSKLPLLIVGIVLLLGVGVALFFILRKPAEPEAPVQEEPSEELEPIWEPSENSEDPSKEFQDHHQAIIDNPETTPEEKFVSTLEIANQHTVAGRYEESEALLNSLSREDLTLEQQFRLYGVYQYLYEQSGNTAMAEEYSKLAEEAMNAYLQSQPVTSEE